MSKAILDKIDIQTLKKKNSALLSNVLGAGSTDILFTVEMRDSIGYLSLLLEHQSKPDEKMAFRIQKYMLQLCDAHLREHPKDKLTLIYPIIYCTGTNKYTHLA